MVRLFHLAGGTSYGRTLDRPQEPTFKTVKLIPTHSPPASVVTTEPFIKPVNQPRPRCTG